MTHKIVVGLGFGDEGKGTVVDYLCATQDIKAVVRFSGGPQAAHNVVMPDGRHHTFAQFGSGTFHGVPTYLSKHMLVNPLNLVNEYEALKKKVDFDPLDRLFIDHNATIVTPYHRQANRLRELARGEGRHGSCGQGIGETMMLKNELIELRMGDIVSTDIWAESQLRDIADRYTSEFGDDFLSDLPDPHTLTIWYSNIASKLNICFDTKLDELLDLGDCVFEGSQGVLLDEWYGFHPYTTWSTTTPENALQILGERDSEVIGVTRSYTTRHGAGPFPSETWGWEESWPEPHNGTGEFQGAWRAGFLDLVLLNYASSVSERIDQVAVTHLDRKVDAITAAYIEDGQPKEVLWTKFTHRRPKEDLDWQERLTNWLLTIDYQSQIDQGCRSEDELLAKISEAVGAPVTLVSHGPSWTDKLALDVEMA